jgi:hypothetical protein
MELSNEVPISNLSQSASEEILVRHSCPGEKPSKIAKYLTISPVLHYGILYGVVNPPSGFGSRMRHSAVAGQSRYGPRAAFWKVSKKRRLPKGTVCALYRAYSYCSFAAKTPTAPHAL